MPSSKEGVRRARARAASADLRLLVLDATGDWRAERDKLVASTERWDDTRDIVVVNKIDRAPVGDVRCRPVSALSGDGWRSFWPASSGPPRR